MPGVNRSKVRRRARGNQQVMHHACITLRGVIGWVPPAHIHPTERGREPSDAPAPSHAAVRQRQPRQAGERGKGQHETGEIVEDAVRFCRSFPRPPRSRERPRPAFRKGAHTDWTCAWKTTRAGQGPSHPGGWMHGGPAKFACYCYCYASGDDEMGRAWWTGGAARARARLVGCRPWATAQAAGPVVSCTRPLHQAGQARGRWATGCFSYFLLL